MSRAFTHEEFIDKLKTKNNHFDTIEILGKYINTKSKIQCKCKICGYEWKAIPEVLLNGNGCRKCGRIISAEKTKIKHSDYLISFSERHPTVELLTEYIGCSKPITCYCVVCNHTWVTTPINEKDYTGCPHCNRVQGNINKRKSHDVFVEEIKNILPNIQIMSEYIKHDVDVKCKCLECGTVWEATPEKLYKKRGCPICKRKKVRTKNNTSTYIIDVCPELIPMLKDKDDAYNISVGSGRAVTFVCPDCKNEFTKIIKNVAKQGISCPICSDKLSYPNKYLRGFHSQLPIKNIKYEYSPKWATPYRYDGYFEYNKAHYVVEMDGAQHYLEQNGFGVSLKRQQEIDCEKNRLAVENSHILIRIDCRKSDPSFIKSQLQNSMFDTIFDLSYVNWIKCEENACKNIVKEICDYYKNNPIRISDIAKIFNISTSTVRRCLEKGDKLGWCNYDKSLNQKIGAIVGGKKKMKPTIVLDENKNIIISCESINECQEYLCKSTQLNFSASKIGKARETGNKYKGYYFMKGEKDYDIYLPQSD